VSGNNLYDFNFVLLEAQLRHSEEYRSTHSVHATVSSMSATNG